MEEPTKQERLLEKLSDCVAEIKELIRAGEFTEFKELQVFWNSISEMIPYPPNDIDNIDLIEEVVLSVICKIDSATFRSKAKCRKTQLVLARVFVFLFARSLTTITSGKLGDIYEKDHSTVLCAVKTLESQLYLSQNQQYLKEIIEAFGKRGYVMPKRILRLVK